MRADDLFCRKSDLRAIVNAGWSRGTKIPRLGRWYDPFCPKILGILGKTKLPRTIASRVLAYNLTRVMNIMGIRPLMAAMRA